MSDDRTAERRTKLAGELVKAVAERRCAEADLHASEGDPESLAATYLRALAEERALVDALWGAPGMPARP